MHTKPHVFLLSLSISFVALFGLTGCFFKQDVAETHGAYVAEGSLSDTAAPAQPEPTPTPPPAAEKKGSSKKPAKNVAAKNSSAKSQKTDSKKRAAADPEKVQRDLDAFAKDCLAKMNRNIRPGINAKEVVAVAEGFRARYLLIDPDSLRTSFSASENKAVDYIGRLSYHEVEYVCVGKTKAQALAGPFSEHNRRPLTELIKHMRGKWSY